MNIPKNDILKQLEREIDNIEEQLRMISDILMALRLCDSDNDSDYNTEEDENIDYQYDLLRATSLLYSS